MTQPGVNQALEKLSRSSFRSRFRLRKEELAYLRCRGLAEVERHARDFIAQRIAPASLPNDGKQTPYRGHPVFIAQHATATCCRSCIQKWHGFSKGADLTRSQQDYLVSLIAAWLARQAGDPPEEPGLFG